MPGPGGANLKHQVLHAPQEASAFRLPSAPSAGIPKARAVELPVPLAPRPLCHTAPAPVADAARAAQTDPELQPNPGGKMRKNKLVVSCAAREGRA